MSQWNHDTHYRLGNGIDRRLHAGNPEFDPRALWDALNMVYLRDTEEPEKMRGASQIGTTTTGDSKVTGLFDYSEGSRLIAAAADGKIYERNAGNFAQSTNGTGFNTGTDVRWSGGMFYGATTAANLLLISNGVDSPKKYTSSAGVSALGGSPPSTGKFGTSWGGRWWLFSGDTASYSAVNDAETWTGADAGSIQIDRGSGDVTGVTVFMGNLFIFKRRKIFRMLPTNNLSETAVREVSHIIGTAGHFTVAEARGGFLMFESDNGIAGAVATSSTGGFYVDNVSDRVKPLLDRRDKGQQATNWATYNEDRDEYWFQYGTATSTPSEGIICNTARGRSSLRFTRHNRANLTAGCIYRSSGTDLQVVGNSTGEIYELHSGDDWDGTNYTGRLQTSEHSQSRLGYMKNYGRIFADFQTNGAYPLTLKTKLGRKDLPSPGGQTMTSTAGGVSDGWGVGEWGAALWGGGEQRGDYFRFTDVRRGYNCRLTFETTGADQWFRVNGYHIEFKQRAEQVAA